jgi:hypothetical protein
MKNNNTIEISVKGKWCRIPALYIDAFAITVRGRWIKVAIISDEDWLASELEDPEVCLEKLKKHDEHGLKADIFSFSQKLPATQPKYSYPMEWESIAAIHVTSFREWWEKLPQESRKNVRRSQRRGIVCRVKKLDDELVEGIVEVNNDSPIRQGKPFDHYGKTAEEVRRDQSTYCNRSDFVAAYHGNELTGFLKIVYRGEIASILQILAKPSRSDLRPVNALIAKAVELCEENGLSYLTYGNYHYGNQGVTSLNQFKTRNGFEEVFVPRYYIPLTMRGRVSMALKLHHGIMGVFPQSIIRLGVRMRSGWYDRKNSQRAGVAQR